MPEVTPTSLIIPKASTNLTFDKLAILKDSPLFGDATDNEKLDAFDHAAFATAIFTLLQDNDPPLSIGLFGSWGIGKSTVLNILKQKIDQSPSSHLKFICFNAWKYSGDSFRRQFLIEIARGLHGDGHAEVKRLQELNFNAVIKESQQKQFLAAIGDAFKEAVKLQMSLRSVGILRFLLGLCGVATAVLLGALFSKVSITAGSIISATVISAVFLWFSNIKFEDLFLVQETPIYDPKLVFPEQFESEFRRLISGLARRNQRAVIAIDDIDRCEA